MAPPDLPRNAPGLDVLHPVEEGRFPLLRHEHGLALAHRRDRRLRQRLGVDVPLIGEERLEHRAGAVAVRHDVLRRLDLVDQPRRFQPLDNLLARRLKRSSARCQRHTVSTSQIRAMTDAFTRNAAIVLSSVESWRFVVEHIDQRQIVPLADLEIVEVMRRRDLHRAGAFFRIGVVVADDRNAAADQRQDRVSCRSDA